jgi:hypothetical protein
MSAVRVAALRPSTCTATRRTGAIAVVGRMLGVLPDGPAVAAQSARDFTVGQPLPVMECTVQPILQRSHRWLRRAEHRRRRGGTVREDVVDGAAPLRDRREPRSRFWKRRRGRFPAETELGARGEPGKNTVAIGVQQWYKGSNCLDRR